MISSSGFLLKRAPLLFVALVVLTSAAAMYTWRNSKSESKPAFLATSEQMVERGVQLQAIDTKMLEVQAILEKERIQQQATGIQQVFNFDAQQELLTAGIVTTLKLQNQHTTLLAQNVADKDSAGTNARPADLFHANLLLSGMYKSLASQKTELLASSADQNLDTEQQAKLADEMAALEIARNEQIASIKALQQQKQQEVPPAQIPETEVVQDQEVENFDLSAEELAATPSGRFLSHFPTNSGGLRKPAVGSLYHHTSGSLLIKTADQATVVTPYDGIVDYVGTFRDFGPMVIIRHQASDGSKAAHSILYGLDSLIVTKGLPVFKGEPLGFMGLAADRKNKLYFELQISELRVDPLGWLE